MLTHKIVQVKTKFICIKEKKQKARDSHGLFVFNKLLNYITIIVYRIQSNIDNVS